MEKVCFKCYTKKSVNDFPKRKYKGNISFRNECKQCTGEFQKIYRTDNKKSIAEHKKQWVLENRERKRLNNYKWFLENKEKAVKSCRNHRLNNMLFYRLKRSERRALTLNATPTWVNKKEIQDIYLNCPEGYEVDHIIPLKGKNVCGLHVPANLQYLTRSDNRKKGNKLL